MGSELATGAYSSMSTVKRATIFQVAVLSVELRVGVQTQGALRDIARYRTYSVEREAEVVWHVLQAKRARITVRFLHEVELGAFLREAREEASRAFVARLLSRSEYRQVPGELRWLLRPIWGRGFRAGDELIYDVHPDGLRIAVRSSEDVLVEERIQNPRAGVVLLATYLAPKGSFRTPLARSLFR